MTTTAAAVRATQCEGKERFAVRSLAAQISKRKTRRGQPLTTYHCPHCGGWHVGHNTIIKDARRA